MAKEKSMKVMRKISKIARKMTIALRNRLEVMMTAVILAETKKMMKFSFPSLMFIMSTFVF